jgi:hypothetical protein
MRMRMWKYVVKAYAIPLILFFKSGSTRELKNQIGKKGSRNLVSKIQWIQMELNKNTYASRGKKYALKYQQIC